MGRAEKNMAISAVLRKGLSILLCFNTDATTLSLTEIAQKVELPITTVARILKALCDTNFLNRDDKTKRYELGSQCYYLGAMARKSGMLRKVALPIMRNLRDLFLETVILYVREGNERVYFDQVEGPRTIKRLIEPGTRVPLWSGAAGRCFMAYMTQKELGELFQEIRPICRNTIIDTQLLLKKIRETRENGYSVSCSEREEGVCSVASPIFECSKKIRAVLTITGPEDRLNQQSVEKIIPVLKESAQTISDKLNFSRFP